MVPTVAMRNAHWDGPLGVLCDMRCAKIVRKIRDATRKRRPNLHRRNGQTFSEVVPSATSVSSTIQGPKAIHPWAGSSIFEEVKK